MRMLKINCVGLRGGGCRDHAQGQDRHAAGAAASRSCDRHYALTATTRRAGAALNGRTVAARADLAHFITQFGAFDWWPSYGCALEKGPHSDPQYSRGNSRVFEGAARNQNNTITIAC